MTQKNKTGFNLIIYPDVNNKILNSMSEDIRKLFGDKENAVKLENVEFERFFEVSCTDQVEARKVITLEFMEKLLKFKKDLNKNIAIVYHNQRAYIFVEKFYVVDAFKLFLHGCNEKIIKETSESFNTLAEIIKLI